MFLLVYPLPVATVSNYRKLAGFKTTQMYHLRALEARSPKWANIKDSRDSQGESVFLPFPVSRCFPLPPGKLAESFSHRITLTLTSAFLFHTEGPL